MSYAATPKTPSNPNLPFQSFSLRIISADWINGRDFLYALLLAQLDALVPRCICVIFAQLQEAPQGVLRREITGQIN
jgi:hypothetical protein